MNAYIRTMMGNLTKLTILIFFVVSCKSSGNVHRSASSIVLTPVEWEGPDSVSIYFNDIPYEFVPSEVREISLQTRQPYSVSLINHSNSHHYKSDDSLTIYSAERRVAVKLHNDSLKFDAFMWDEEWEERIYYVTDTQPEAVGGSDSIYNNLIYPENARRKNQEGNTVVRFIVDKNGDAKRASVARSSGHSSLDWAAVSAVMRTKFTPASHYGEPVNVTMVVPIRFRLG